MRTSKLSEKVKADVVNSLLNRAEEWMWAIRLGIDSDQADFNYEDYNLNSDTDTIGDAWNKFCDEEVNGEIISVESRAHCVIVDSLDILKEAGIFSDKEMREVYKKIKSLLTYPLKNASYNSYKESLKVFLEDILK